MRRHFKSVEIVFYLSILFFLIPIFLFFFVEKKLENNLGSKDLGKEWELKTATRSEIINLPFDYKNNKILSSESKIVLEKKFSITAVSNFENPTLVLGRIGDNAVISVNDCLISIETSNNNSAWFWSALRYGYVPSKCLESINTIKIEIAQWGFANKGIYSGPIGIGEYVLVQKYIKIIDFLKYYIFFVFGVVLVLSVFIYYLFVYFLVPERKYNLVFSLFSLFTGIFEICVSTVPYRYLGSATLALYINFLSGVLASIFLIEFINVKLNQIKRRYSIYLYSSFIVIFIASLFSKNINDIYLCYTIWFTYFLVFITSNYFYLLFKSFRKSNYDQKKYMIGFSLFILTLFSDVYSSLRLDISLYLIPYGFIVLLIISSLTLAKEAADAFLYVEAQVGERTHDLSSALEQLKGLEKMKERFFANVSHDLKTPITIALGAIEETKNQFANTIGRVLEPADRSLRRLQEMVLGILDTVKAESGTLQLEWQAVKLTDFIQNIIEPYAVVCRKENVKLEFNGEGFGGLQVPMDPQKIERVLENLLSNAFKFTKRTTRSEKIIRVSLATDQAKVYIYIDDSGIGIPEGEHEKVFERYFQSSRTDLKEHGGSGIGLSFVKEMISLHNGSVYAAESPFHGTRFTIELPLSQNIENVQSYRIQESGTPVLRGSLDVEYPPTVPETINPARYTLLIAEDNPEVAQIVYSTLKDNYNIYFGEHGARALKILQEHDFDCVVSDIQMPEMTGDQLVEAIRKETKWKSIPIVMLSSHGDDDTIVKLLKLGANDYVAKPFRREILLSRIQAQISAHKGTTWNTKLEKLQELGQLVSGIGHQGKNRISRVGSNYPLLIKIAKDLARKLEATQPEESKRLQEKIQAVGELIGKGYNQTLDLFRAIDRYASGSDKKTVISIDEIVKDTVTLLEEKITLKNITVKTHGVSSLSFEGYNEIREAILNIISNAVDAVESGQGKIDIEGSDQGKDILLSIKDNGGGILKENLAHVFEPFFTSKKVGEGTGLGLYLARDAVELKNQGKLTITSDGPGTGASVHIRLPKVVPDVEQQRRPSMHNVGV